VVVIRWLNKLGILFKHTIKITATLRDVTFQSASKSNVRVGVNEHFHVHYLSTHKHNNTLHQMLLMANSVIYDHVTTKVNTTVKS